MSWLQAIWSELLGLFVDDGRFAFTIAAWLLACGLILPRLALPSRVPPVILFVGLVAILAESVVRRTQQNR